MALHRLTRIDLGVTDVAAAREFYADFGLKDLGEGRMATREGGEQLRLVQTDRRRLVDLGIGAENPDDLDRIQSRLDGLGLTWRRDDDRLRVHDPGTRVTATVEIAPRLEQQEASAPDMNGPAHHARANERAEGAFRVGPVRPRRLGHVVVGSTDLDGSYRLFIDALGFKISDEVGAGARFLRCSTDHHNLFIQPAPIDFLHHTSWEVEDVDEIGRGATAMLDKDPECHVWGLGRHNVGSNFFWYLRDPAGNFAEYYSDLDVILDDQLWEPGVFEPQDHGIVAWGPRPPRGFFRAPDLAERMMGAHSTR